MTLSFTYERTFRIIYTLQYSLPTVPLPCTAHRQYSSCRLGVAEVAGTEQAEIDDEGSGGSGEGGEAGEERE